MWLFLRWISVLTCFVSLSIAQKCTTPNNKRGFCVPLIACDNLFNLSQIVSIPDYTRQLIRNSRCYTEVSGTEFFVCCANEIGIVFRQPTVIKPSNGLANVLPSPGQCGFSSISSRIQGGTDTEIDEFPWMVLLEYQSASNSPKKTLCAGSLINTRYILTAAHCLTIAPLVSVRLGEYNTEKNPDCVIIMHEWVCSNASVDIEEIFVHENYHETLLSQYNDIALIRLAEDVVETKFIKPICLPNVSLRSATGSKVVVAGWGSTLTSEKSPIKQKLIINIVDFHHCHQLFTTKFVYLKDSQLCAGGELRKDSCVGDSGGPLMKLIDGYWYLEGIVSIGQNKCGLEGWPGAYTRVSSYRNWIESKMRP